MRQTEAIQREVWGLADIDVVPAAQLKAATHAGGQAAGAFVGSEMIGFSYGLAARPHGRGMRGTGLHSHMVAVREEGRQRGVGRALKWFQRRWCLERDLTWITWTFDPLQSRNANLNFRHLGVVSNEYLVDFYGAMAGPLGGDASDRLVALWLLDSAAVTRRAAADPPATGHSDALPTSEAPTSSAPTSDDGSEPSGDDEIALSRRLGRDPDYLLGHARSRALAPELAVLRREDVIATQEGYELGRGGGCAVLVKGNDAFQRALVDSSAALRLLVAVPQDVGVLRTSQPVLVENWRAGLRAAIIPALEAGFSVVDFSEGSYVLERTPQP